MSNKKVIIGLGSNIEPETHIREALNRLKKQFRVKKITAFRYTKPLLFTGQPDFLNGAVLIETSLSRQKLNSELKKIEKTMGRIPSELKNGPRIIDLDIVLFDDVIVDEDYSERPFLQDFVAELTGNRTD